MTCGGATGFLIGLDDTDNADSRGTGHLARMLLAECTRRGWPGICVCRHQLLLDERIPYTSHNSSACVVVGAGSEGSAAAGSEPPRFAFDFVAAAAAEGSDPGVCVARAAAVPAAVTAFGRRATAEVLDTAEALAVAADAGLDLRQLGGTGLGVIGALAAVGLYAGGEDGRLIELPGLRDLGGRVAADEIRGLGISLARVGEGPAADEVETLGWVRPRRSGGCAVLPIEWSDEHDAWIPVDRKRSRPLE